jgi:hypothetical protein
MVNIFRMRNKKGGIKKMISLTPDPAIELKGVLLSSETPKEVVDLNKLRSFNDELRIVAGPVIVPNKLIPREDENGDMFYITATREDIREFYELWKEDGYLINFEHTDRISKSAKVIDSFIIGDKEVEGYTHILEEGTLFLMTQYDETEFKEIKEGKKNGYSLEGSFLLEPFYLSKSVDNIIKVRLDIDNINEQLLERKLINVLSERGRIISDLISKKLLNKK